MTQAELQKKYDRFLDLVSRMRAKQDYYERYRIGTDRDAKRKLERQVDNLVKEEMKTKASGQKELF